MPIDVSLDPTPWAVVQDVVVQYLGKPSLQRDLAFHFHRIGRAVVIFDLFLQSASGITASNAQEVAGRTRPFVQSYFRDLLLTLRTETVEIEEQVERVLASMKQKQEAR